MASKESIGFDFSSIYIPPWPIADYELVCLPFTDEDELIRHPLNEDYPFFALPDEAFDESGANLICFAEKRLLGNELAGKRPLPKLPITAAALRPEVFAHIELPEESPKALCDLLDANGLVISPLYNSPHRFIDARFSGVTSDHRLDYAALHPLTVEPLAEGNPNLTHLAQAVADISTLQLAALGGIDLDEPFAGLCGGNMTEAIVLSEYARRIWCSADSLRAEDFGGIISYYEVLLTVRGLFRAMQTLVDFSIAGNSTTKLKEQLEQSVKTNTANTAQRFALDTLNSTKGKAATRTNAALNIGEAIVREAFDFLQLCVSATTGIRTGSVVRKSAPPADTHDSVIIKTPKFLEPAYNFYQDNEPRYLQDRYCEGSFGAAIASQFLSTLADPAPWKRCDNPECGAYFKHHFAKTGRTNDKASSCSPKCSTRKRNRLYNMEASAVRTAVKRYNTVDEAVAYIEKRLAGEVALADLPKARKRWRAKHKTLLIER
jgi:hypothetical protein